MSIQTLSATHTDAAYLHKRKAKLVFPIIVIPFLAALFWILGGGKGERYSAQEVAEGRPGVNGFNASMPNAKGGNINGRDVDGPGYGKAATGQVLSSFTNTRQDSIARGLKAMPVSQESNAPTPDRASSLVATTPATLTQPNRVNAAALAATQPKANRTGKASGYYYKPAGGNGYYTGGGTDQQLDAQVRSYEAMRAQPTGRTSQNQPTNPPKPEETARPAAVVVSDNLTATRLSEPMDAANAFNTAPTSGSRRKAERAVLSGGNSYGSKKTVAWMIPVVVHEDQAIKTGNTVKLRLTKEISADGITIPANTILHAICQTTDDRLRMVVHNVQLGGQLIPLDLEVYDMDGIAGVNMPGLSNQVGGQMQASAIQGVQLPGVGGLVNSVANQARMSASNSARQPTVRLKAGYNLFLKA